MLNSKGIGALFVLVGVFVVAVIALGWEGYHVYNQGKNNPSLSSPFPQPTILQPTPTNTPIPTTAPLLKTNAPKSSTSASQPLIDCIGPDGKHSQKTQADCNAFNNAWATPTPTQTPSVTQTSSGCDSDTDLANLTVSIQPASGQSIVGDAGVTMSNGSGACAGSDSRLPYTQVIHQGSPSVTYVSYRPGEFHIDVQYHSTTQGFDVSLHSGDNSLNVTVSN